jgi:hypothetical protein
MVALSLAVKQHGLLVDVEIAHGDNAGMCSQPKRVSERGAAERLGMKPTTSGLVNSQARPKTPLSGSV